MSAIPRRSREYLAPSLFDRALDLSRINYEVLAFVTLVLVSIATHLWGLERMALHHDESIHAWMSWRFFEGVGTFTCAGGRVALSYCYDPVYHGPSLYVLTFISYFLFGDGDAQARYPQAVAGIVMVASTWMLRPYLGKRGAFIAAVLLALAPSLLYYTRFARHDGLMILWTLWMVIGLFRFVDTGQGRYLYLLAAGLALAIATHELYYILFFLFGSILIIRLLSELFSRRKVMIGVGAIFGLAVAVEMLILFGVIGSEVAGIPAGGMALLLMTVTGMGLLALRVWDDEPVVTRRFRALWREDRNVFFMALGILASLYVVLYGVFFTDPPGIIDGLYQGLAYWLGSQHEYARGDQPWYYYLMLLPLYEPLALFGSLAAMVYLFTRNINVRRAPREVDPETKSDDVPETTNGVTNGSANWDYDAIRESSAEDEMLATERVSAPALPLVQAPPVPLFPLFLAFWFVGALVAFSWAGEKMPWLLTHIALPGNLLVAWGLGRLADSVNWRSLSDRRVWLIPPALILMLIALGVALWRFWSTGEGQQGQASLLQGLVPLFVVGAIIFSLLTISQSIGARLTAVICTLTIAGLVGMYMIRATWMVVYNHPDTPREPLVYTQSSPDVPRIVDQLRELAIAQTRNTRSAQDIAGGLSLPVIMDVGDTNGDGSLAWPYQWYLRDFQRMENRNADFFRNATPDSFLVAAGDGSGEQEHAPVVMIYAPHITEVTRQALEANYVQRYTTKLNWWFPEGSKCDPQAPGYKRFYHNSFTLEKAQADRDCASVNFETTQFHSPLAPLLWPFDRSHWPDTFKYIMYRELPEPLRLNGREMEVWVRRDLATTGAADTSGSAAVSSDMVKLVAERVVGLAPDGTTQLVQPRGVVVDQQGNTYVSDTDNDRILVFGPDGAVARTIGSFGSGEGQFNEPRGLALDTEGNIYVADTWNARIVKLDSEGNFLTAWGEGQQNQNGQLATITDRTEAGNQANPMGFYGPRSVAVDAQGNVYIADTGNRRIVVTNSEGEFQYQWGYEGETPGLFEEPSALALDTQGNLYVADVWNSRVQVFAPGPDGRMNTTPTATWNVPGWQPNSYDDPYIAANDAGQVFVSVPSRNQVIQATTTGDILLRWGGAGADTASFTNPSGLFAAPDSSLYVVDRGNGRVMQFTLPEGVGVQDS
jgi:uncharacterized protein (TIGR03663 family)